MKSLNDILSDLYRGTPQHEEWMIAFLEGSWPALLGDRLAEVCRPYRLERGCLTIEITDGAWTGAIQGMQADLCDRISAATRHEVRQLRFRKPADSAASP